MPTSRRRCRTRISSSPRSRRSCRRWRMPAPSCGCLRGRPRARRSPPTRQFATGPRREGDADGPSAYHVVLLDNGRSEMLGGDFHAMLRCIRCGACLNHCPVYGDHRRARLWLALCRADGGGADAGSPRHRPRARSAQRLELLRALRGGVPHGAFRCRRCCGLGGSATSRGAIHRSESELLLKALGLRRRSARSSITRFPARC